MRLLTFIILLSGCHQHYVGLLRSGNALSREPVTELDTAHSVLFLGNSYTSSHFLAGRVFNFWTNDNPHLPLSVGYHLQNGSHLIFQQNSLTEQSWLSASRNPGPDGWGTVIIQEESRSLAYPPGDDRYIRSTEVFTTLVSQLTAENPAARIIIFATWGRAVGDSHSELNSFLRMQNRLEDGINRLVSSLEARFQQLSVDVAPAGQAFREVYQDELASGHDPNRLGSFFHSLYASDGSHPSWRGSYLAASVIYETLTGRDAPELAGEDHPIIRRYLRYVAHRIVRRTRMAAGDAHQRGRL